MRAGGLERGPGDLGGARQRGHRGRVEQPRPAPHQRHEEQLGHRVQVQRQQRAVTVHGRPAGVGLPRPGRARPPVPPGHGHRELQPVVEHGARADRGRPRMDEPAAGRLRVAFDARQPDPVPVARDVQRVRPADVRDPGAFRGRRDHPSTPGQPSSGRYLQVHLWSAPEHQLATFREADDLAGHGSDMCSHGVSLSSAESRRASLDPGMAPAVPRAVSSITRAPGAIAASHSWGGPSPGAGMNGCSAGVRRPHGAPDTCGGPLGEAGAFQPGPLRREHMAVR